MAPGWARPATEGTKKNEGYRPNAIALAGEALRIGFERVPCDAPDGLRKRRRLGAGPGGPEGEAQGTRQIPVQ